ncbi:MAG TPA: methionyl-tRNA formyltransferase [Candidatus Paceibacterota bacterium]|nr:methionyl-tRNA formyltransferase [Candidatus Paceibacterota bacterium]
MMRTSNIRFAFFGMPPLAAGVLSELSIYGYEPILTVSTAEFSPRFMEELATQECDVFIVASFGKILPKQFLDIPKKGVLNVHPSLLPRLRGASPIRSAILNDEKETGVTIMLLDEEMDHGPIIAQKKIAVSPWPPRGRELDDLLAHEGGKLLAQILPLWVSGEIEARPQNHDIATYCKKFAKEDGLLDLSDDPYKNLLKIRAFDGWPGTYAFFERAGKKLRVQILDAHLEDGVLSIDRVKPEGKNEMPYADFLRSGAQPCAR